MTDHTVRAIMDRALRAARFAEANPEHPQAMTQAKLIAEVEMLSARESALRERLVEVSVALETRQEETAERLDALQAEIEAAGRVQIARDRRMLLRGIFVGVLIELAAVAAIAGVYHLF